MEKRQSNPVRADFDDLVSLKKRAVFPLMKTNNMAFSGFGEVKSPFKTRGLDFQEVRAYQPGDDIRLIDWRVTAKYGKPFTKLYTDEKERQVYFICDMRTRMKFASQGAFKSVWVARIAAFLAYMAQNRCDKTAYTILSADMADTSGATCGQEAVLSMLQTLERVSDPTQTKPDRYSLAQALEVSVPLVRWGGIVFICSDFSDWDEKCESIVARWGRKNTCILIQVYDALEERLPQGIFPISNGQDISFLNTNRTAFMRTYEQEFQNRQKKLLKAVETYQWGFLPIRTDSDGIDLVESYCYRGMNG